MAEISYRCSASIDEVQGVSKHHLPGKTRHDVKMLTVTSQKVLSIPDDIGVHFPILEVVRFSYCQMREVHSEHLQQFPSLKILYLANNKLSEIPSDLFRYTQRVTYVNFESNHITVIGYQFFNNLKSLTLIYLKENPCTKRSNLAASDIKGWKELVQRKCDYSLNEEPESKENKTTGKNHRRNFENISQFIKNIVKSSKHIPNERMNRRCRKTFEELWQDHVQDDEPEKEIEMEDEIVENTSVDTSDDRLQNVHDTTERSVQKGSTTNRPRTKTSSKHKQEVQDWDELILD